MTARIKTTAVNLLIGLACVFCLLPVAVTALSSFMSEREMWQGAHLIPLDFNLWQFEEVLLKTPRYLIWFWNSVKISAVTVLASLPVSLAAGYGFAKFNFRFKNAIFFIYIIVMLMPFQATLVPQYITVRAFGLMDTTAAVVLPNIFSAFGAFLMTQFIRGIGDEYLEAAVIDGAGGASSFFYIIVPLARPAISALAILLFIESWSMVEQPLIFLTDASLFPLSLYLGGLSARLYAGGFIYLIFPVMVYLLGYEDLTNGIAVSGLK